MMGSSGGGGQRSVKVTNVKPPSVALDDNAL